MRISAIEARRVKGLTLAVIRDAAAGLGLELYLIGGGRLSGSRMGMTVIVNAGSWTVRHPGTNEERTGTFQDAYDGMKLVIAAAEAMAKGLSAVGGDRLSKTEKAVIAALGKLIKKRGGSYYKSVVADIPIEFDLPEDTPAYHWSKNTNNRSEVYTVTIVLLPNGMVTMDIATDRWQETYEDIEPTEILPTIDGFDS